MKRSTTRVGVKRGLGFLTTATLTSVALFALAGQALAVASAAAERPVAVWHMEKPARMVDSSDHGNDGTTTNIRRADGFSRKGYHFDGTSSIVTVPSTPSLNPGRANISITVHARFEKLPKAEGYDLLRKGLSTNRGGDYKIEAERNAQSNGAWPTCTFRGSAATAKVVGLVNVADDRWHAITCAKTSNRVQIVVDGKTVTRKVEVGSIANTAPLTIGGKSIGGDSYAGDMDEASVEIG
ncbi:MAG: LamG-like jellyroll fold domain-containing protein [Egibacteraceae bacterium]